MHAACATPDSLDRSALPVVHPILEPGVVDLVQRLPDEVVVARALGPGDDRETALHDQGDQETETAGPGAVKDWSNDDTEPGDDDAFNPVIHQIIGTGAYGGTTEDDG